MFFFFLETPRLATVITFSVNQSWTLQEVMPDHAANGTTVRQTIVSSIEAPKLRGVSTKHFIEFRKNRELYEKQINEKNQEPGTRVPLISYKSSIENADLNIFIAAGWVSAATIDHITELQIRQCIEDRCHRVLDGEHLHIIEDAVKKVAMKMQIFEAEDRVWTMHRDYLTCLRSAGYEELPNHKPHIAIQHVLKRLKPQQLRSRIQSIIKWRKDEQFDKKNFNAFMREVAAQAKKLQEEKAFESGYISDSDTDKGQKVDTRTRSFAQRVFPKSLGGRYTSSPSLRNTKTNNHTHVKRSVNIDGVAPSNKRKREEEGDRLPACLNPKCKERHFIFQCPISDDATKTRLRNEYRLAKKARIDKGKIASVIDQNGRHHSALFSAAFLKGSVTCHVLADQGADANLLPPDVFEQLRHSSEVTVNPLRPSRNYKTISGDTCVHCESEIISDVQLKIRHGSNLILRNVRWHVSNEKLESAILGRAVLESLGCDNRTMLEAAISKYDGDVDVAKRLTQEEMEREGSIAALYGESLYHSGADEEDGLENIEEQAEFGDDPPSLIQAELEKRVEEAVQSGLSAKGKKRLLATLAKFPDVFKLRLGSGGPAKVAPMKIDLMEEKRPVKVKVRRYPPDQRAFLDEYFAQLVQFGFVVPDPTVEWQAAPHLVPKPSKSKYRVTIDLRPVNAATKAEVWPMPNIEAELSDFSGSEHFASLDFCAAYWQLPLHPDSLNACGVIAPQGCFSSTRVLHGLKNATAHFQETIPALFSCVGKRIKSWLDDFTLHSKTEDDLLDSLEKFVEVCDKYNLKLSARKCVFYSKSVRWCGRIIEKDGYTLDPRNIEALRNMHFPVTADELCQFIHCCRWMAAAIPDFNKRCQPLNEALEKAYALTGKRKKSALKSISLSKVSWGPIHEAAFHELQDALKSSVKLTFPKAGKVTCVFTDASDAFWAGIVTQISPEELGKDPIQQGHLPLAFLGGQFAGAQRNWTTYEKEAFAIVKVFDKLDYVLLGVENVHIFTDHRNLLFVFAPLALRPSSPRYVLSKVHRWAIHLSRFDFDIEHIEGSKNVFADLLTRWAKGNRQGQIASGNVMALYSSLVPSADENLWPDVAGIARAQRTAGISGEKEDGDGVQRIKGKVIVPKNATDLKLQILTAAHCGSSGHRGAGATANKVGAEFHWDSMTTDVKEFTQACLHCIVSRNGERIPRPLATALHGKTPNEVVHMDFLYMGVAAEQDFKYLLVLKDDLSSYTWLLPSHAPDAESAANALEKWIAAFGSMSWIVSDRGSHFSARMIDSLTTEAKVRHHFTTAYCPWANGSVERLCKEVLRASKALLSEWKLPAKKWPSIVSCVQSVINQAPVERLGKSDDGGTWRTPMQVFTGRKPAGILLRPVTIEEVADGESLAIERALQVANACDLHSALDYMHKEVAGRSEHRRTRAQKLHNARTGVTPVNFRVGDFVLVRSNQKRSHKLDSQWIGPKRVVEVMSDLVFRVEELNSTRTETAHAQRMLHYPPIADSTEVTRELCEQAEFSEGNRHMVRELMDIREQNGAPELLVGWEGWEDKTDATWEPLSTLREDVPGMVWDFLHAGGKRRLKEKILNLLY